VSSSWACGSSSRGNMTRGEASDALTLAFAVRAARRWQNEQGGRSGA
jgi:hypothetical protein